MDRPGFATGLLTGLGLGIGLVLLLALIFPPFVLSPPDVDAAIGSPPPAPLAPGPETGLFSPRLPEPLIALPSDARPGPDTPGGTLSGLAPQVAPDVFEGSPAGSPSLVPLGAD